MITFLEGIIDEKEPTHVVINVGGVGYEVVISLNCYDRLPATGERVRLLTHDHIREDEHRLFGFVTAEERRVFGLLLGVSGIGPKIAISALSGMTDREIKGAIRAGDVKRLSSISGIGKKTAERMILELREKFNEGDVLISSIPGRSDPESNVKMRDAILALVSLGYKRAEAQDLVLRVISLPNMGNATVEDIVRKSLAG